VLETPKQIMRTMSVEKLMYILGILTALCLCAEAVHARHTAVSQATADAANPIPDTTITLGKNILEIDLEADSVFANLDTGKRIYRAESNRDLVAVAVVSEGHKLIVVPINGGTAHITVIAEEDREGGREKTDTFRITVNQAPRLAQSLDDRILPVESGALKIDLNGVFVDPDDALVYVVGNSNPIVLAASEAGGILTLMPRVVGVAEIRLMASDERGGEVSQSFLVTVSGPPSVRHEHPVVNANSGESVSVEATIRDDSDLNRVTVMLFYRQGGETRFAEESMAYEEDRFVATIPGSVVHARGIEYVIQATDPDANSTRAPPAGVYAVRVQVINGVKKENAHPTGEYRQISMPLDLSDKNPKEVLKILRYDPKKLRFFALVSGSFDTAGNHRFAELSDVNAADPVMRMAPGEAFWLIVKEKGKVIETGPGTSNPTNTPFGIPLHPGWNMIGPPFNFAVPATNLNLKSGQPLPSIHHYRGQWTETSRLEPFEGYAIANNTTDPDTLLINPDLSLAGSAKPATESASTNGRKYVWSLRILAQCGQAWDTDNVLAVSPKSAVAWDRMDRPEPPVIGDYVSAYFPHPEWERPLHAYRVDVRPNLSMGEIWNLEVKTNIGDRIMLAFDGIEAVPPDVEVWLVDEVAAISRNLREVNRYDLAGSSSSGPRQLRLVLGTREFIEANVAFRETPVVYELSQNFPNPFNPATTIRYGLPGAGKVTLKIYNVLGQEMVTLVDAQQQVAGYHVVVWNGRNSNGRMAASGIYLYHLQARGFSRIRKMLLAK